MWPFPPENVSVQIADQGGWVLTVSNRDAKIATFTSAMPNAAKKHGASVGFGLP